MPLVAAPAPRILMPEVLVPGCASRVMLPTDMLTLSAVAEVPLLMTISQPDMVWGLA